MTLIEPIVGITEIRIHVNFQSWKIAWIVLDNISKANVDGRINTFASQKYFKKVRKKMNRFLIKRK